MLSHLDDCTTHIVSDDLSVHLLSCRPAQPQPGSNTVSPVHEPQSASQHDEFATKPSPVKFVPPTNSNNLGASRPPTHSARFDDTDGKDVPQYRGYTNPQTQSRTFKILQDLVDSGQGISPSWQV